METTKSFKVSELLEMLKDGSLIREGYQRTPSHDSKKALEIIDSIKNGRYSGVLTLAEIGESGVLAILDGSSRLKDIEDYVNNKIFKVEPVTEKEVNSNGDVVTVKKKVSRNFENMDDVEKNAFLNYTFNCIILQRTSMEERVKAFVNVNSSVALSNIQKSKGNAPSVVLELVEAFTSSKIVNRVFTARLIQKDEPTAFIYTLLGNVLGVYSSSNKAMVNNVNKSAELESVDVDRLKALFNKFDEVDCSTPKYCLLSHLVNLYESRIDVEALPSFDNRVIYEVATQGANSAEQNEKRLDKSTQALNKFLGYSIKTLKPVKVADALQEATLEQVAK